MKKFALRNIVKQTIKEALYEAYQQDLNTTRVTRPINKTSVPSPGTNTSEQPIEEPRFLRRSDDTKSYEEMITTAFGKIPSLTNLSDKNPTIFDKQFVASIGQLVGNPQRRQKDEENINKLIEKLKQYLNTEPAYNANDYFYKALLAIEDLHDKYKIIDQDSYNELMSIAKQKENETRITEAILKRIIKNLIN